MKEEFLKEYIFKATGKRAGSFQQSDCQLGIQTYLHFVS